MDWYVRVKGRDFELNRLAKIFKSEEACLEVEGGSVNQFILRSNAFFELTKSHEVLKKAKEIIEKLNGIGNLTIDFFNSIECEAVIRIAEDGSKHGSVFLASSITIRDELEVKDLDEDGVSTQERWLRLSYTDEHVQKVIRLLNYGLDNWVNLYRILEVIEGDLGVSISDKGWVSKSRKKLFNRTANSPVIGDLSRHGYSEEEPPAVPMELSEAKRIISNALTHWLNEKL
jgi:hypothetical protein